MQDTGEKEGAIMARKIDNPDMPVGKLKEVADFLPPPGELVLPEETVKVTLSLTKSSLDFFRREAKRHHTKYQRMIREVVDRYAQHHN